MASKGWRRASKGATMGATADFAGVTRRHMAERWLMEETVGDLIARVREHLGKSQYALAAALRDASGRSAGVPDRSRVARWETGRRLPTPSWRAHLAAVLQLSPAELDKAAAVTRAWRTDQTGDSQHAQPSWSERLRYVLAHPGSVDLVSVAHLREQVRGLDERYDRVPSTLLIPEAAQCLGRVVFLRMHARRPYVRHELHEAEAEAATLMGQLVWDASQRRDHDTAVGYFDQAINAARERGGKAAEGLAALRKSFVALYGWRDPKAGLALTERTAHITATASQVITGLAGVPPAPAPPQLREGAGSEPALGAAEADFGQIQPGDPAVYCFSPPKPGRPPGPSCRSPPDAQGPREVWS